MKILTKNDTLVKMIPFGGVWQKEICSLSGAIIKSKKFDLRDFVPEYWRLINAGYKDQTESFNNEYDFSGVSPETAVLAKRLVENAKKISNFGIGQTILAEDNLKRAKNLVLKNAASEARRFIEKYCQLTFQKNDCTDILKFCEEEEAKLKISKSQFSKFPEMKKLSKKDKTKLETELNFKSKEVYELNKEEFGDVLMFHASPEYNWLSILAFGLQNKEILHGNCHGEGIYLANDFDKALHYADSKPGFARQVGIFSVTLSEEDIDFGWGKVIKDPNRIKIKYLCVS